MNMKMVVINLINDLIENMTVVLSINSNNNILPLEVSINIVKFLSIDILTRSI